MVVVAYGLILPQAMLDVPRLGCLNIHALAAAALARRRADPARDPRGRHAHRRHHHEDGRRPRHRADAAACARLGIGARRDRRRACTTGSPCSARRRSSTAIDAWAAGNARAGRRSRADGATYAAKIRKEEAVIDWSGPADEIARQVRAFNPWPVAETRWRGQQLRIWEAARCRGATRSRTRRRAPSSRRPAGGSSWRPATALLEVHRLQLAGPQRHARRRVPECAPAAGRDACG